MSPEINWGRVPDSLRRSVIDTFELMCFCAAEPLVESHIDLQPALARIISFHGDWSGQVCLKVNAAAARTLAENFYGEPEPSLPDSRVEELLNEITNVVCGGMLSRMAPSGNFWLSPAEPLPAGAAPAGSSYEQAFSLESGEVLVSVTDAAL
ncbi:MAG TPA: chemotaxis protein CheX [Bryobacteraceae bacterium]|nr:chemotaxis protein CheX [Bryobacteraceae bacterium]